MSATTMEPLDLKIIATINHCLEKITECLETSFDPHDKKSVSLYRLLCSGLNTRSRLLKSVQPKEIQEKKSHEREKPGQTKPAPSKVESSADHVKKRSVPLLEPVPAASNLTCPPEGEQPNQEDRIIPSILYTNQNKIKMKSP